MENDVISLGRDMCTHRGTNTHYTVTPPERLREGGREKGGRRGRKGESGFEERGETERGEEREREREGGVNTDMQHYSSS